MKPIAKAIAAAAVVGWLASCGDGAPGTTGAAGSGGGGFAGDNIAPRGGSGPGGSGGFAGDNIAPRGGNGPGGSGGTGFAGGTGGIGGFGGHGTGGSGGTGFAGVGGFSGFGGQFCPTPTPPVCGALCGNGRIDSCVVSGPECLSQQAKEECDGQDVGTATCAARGWGSGTLTCGSHCAYSNDGCSPCVPLSPFVTSCGPAPFSTARFNSVSMAATDSEVGIVGVQYDQYKPSLVFARLSSDLRLLSFDTFEDPSEPYAPAAAAVAPLPSGWVIAACVGNEVYLKALDGAGQEIGRTPVHDGDTSNCEPAPVLAARPGGGPLLLWLNEEGLNVSMIAADGLSASDPQVIFAPRVNVLGTGKVGATWIGDAFAVAVPFTPDWILNNQHTLRLLRVEPDGAVRLIGDFLADQVRGDQIRGDVTVASGADARDIRIVFDSYKPGRSSDADYNVMWWRYDAQSPVEPVVLANRVDYYGRAPAVAFGDDSVVVLSPQSRGGPSEGGFGIARVGSDGALAGPIRDIALSPHGLAWPAIIRRGPDVIVSFGGDSVNPLYLVRIKP